MDRRTETTSITAGKLKIFLGMCAGVGKTFAMLAEAQDKLKEGTDVVIGYVETHHRPETEALLRGLPIMERKKVEYRGIVLEEMDLDGVLERRPSLAVVDELPHTNAAGSRHNKRYQDVLELLDAGIDVFTALNVQHIESRVDVIQGITSIPVRETVPDSVIDRADDIQLVDVTPEELRSRLAEGKVYLGDRAATAADNFFRIENLSALREIAMRVMAEKVGQDVREAMQEHHIAGPWKSSERFVVAVGPSPFSEPLIRWTRRIAAATHSPWIAVHVDTFVPLSNEEKDRLSRNLSLVHQLGGETVTIASEDVAAALLQTAKEKNATKIVVGKPPASPLVRFFTAGRSLVDTLIRKSGDIDICVVRAGKKMHGGIRVSGKPFIPPTRVRELGIGLGSVFFLTALFWLIRGHTTYFTIALLYLLSIVFLATRLNRRIILVIAAVTGLLWNFLFIPPIFTFRIGSLQNILMFFTYFVVAVVIGHLTARLRMREIAERMRERRTRVLYQLAQCVVQSRTLDEGLRLAVTEVDSVFNGKCAVTLVREQGTVSDGPHPTSTWRHMNTKEQSVVAWVYQSGKPAGRFTDTLPQSEGIHIPMHTTHGCVGVLSLLPVEDTVFEVAQHELLDTAADHIAALIDRYNLIRQSHKASLAQESEKLYRMLFDLISHELKTPLTIITTATGQITESLNKGDVSPALSAAHESSVAVLRLRRIVENLLSMTRMESDHAKLEAVWCDLEEIVMAAGEQVSDLIDRHRFTVAMPDTIPMIRTDPVLFTHCLANILTNAAQYSPGGSEISVTADTDDKHVVLKISDAGEGLPPEDLGGRIFEKFHRGRNARPGGIGLGLSIVHRFMELAGGTVHAENNPNGKGALFILRFPVNSAPWKGAPNEQ